MIGRASCGPVMSSTRPSSRARGPCARTSSTRLGVDHGAQLALDLGTVGEHQPFAVREFPAAIAAPLGQGRPARRCAPCTAAGAQVQAIGGRIRATFVVEPLEVDAQVDLRSRDRMNESRCASERSPAGRACGCRCIRYYEEVGLLPEPERVTGQRRYDQTVLRRLAVIDVAQRAGLSLEEIRELVEHGNDPMSDRLRELAERRLPGDRRADRARHAGAGLAGRRDAAAAARASTTARCSTTRPCLPASRD